MFGHPEWLDDPRLSSNPERARQRELLDQMMIDLLADLTDTEVLEGLRRAGVPSGPVRTIPELFEQDVPGTPVVSEVQHSTLGAIPAVRLPWRFSRTWTNPKRAAPTLGQDTDDVIAELGASNSNGSSL